MFLHDCEAQNLGNVPSFPRFLFIKRTLRPGSLFIFAFLTGAPYPNARQVGNQDDVCLKLERYGWQPIPSTREFVGTTGRLVSVDHQGRVLVAFATREGATLSARQESGLSLHILRFAGAGKVDLSLVLRTNNRFGYGIYLDSNDGIYARADDTFQFLSELPNDANSSGRWRVLARCPTSCEIMQSASRRTFVVGTSGAHSEDTCLIIDTVSSRAPSTKDCPRGNPYAQAITDHFAYHSGDGIRTGGKRWPLCDPVHDEELPNTLTGSIHPLSDEAFLLLGRSVKRKDYLRAVDLVAVDGRVEFHKEMAKHETLDLYHTTSDETGERFALVAEKWRGGSALLDLSGRLISRRVVVCNKTGEELDTLPVSPAYRRAFDLSLSPDGHWLAVLDQDTLKITRIE